MLGLKYRETCRGVFESNHMLALAGLLIYETLLFVHQHFIYFEAPKNVNCTRRIELFIYPVHSLAFTEGGTLYTGLKVFSRFFQNKN